MVEPWLSHGFGGMVNHMVSYMVNYGKTVWSLVSHGGPWLTMVDHMVEPNQKHRFNHGLLGMVQPYVDHG